MFDTAAHLVDSVLPVIPYRQWVLSFPRQLRLRLAYERAFFEAARRKGVGVLSVMLISFSDRRYEIRLRKAMGASDEEVFVQFLLEARVRAAFL